MLRTIHSADPSPVKQAPDAKALNKSTQLILESIALATPPQAQNYFEPGINRSLVRRSKPKTDYTLPSDMPKYELGFVPTAKPSVTESIEAPIIVQKELVPQDLLGVFQKIAEEDKVKPKLDEGKMDKGLRSTRAYQRALKAARGERKVQSMIKEGFTEAETKKAMDTLREEEALKEARRPAKPLTVEEAMREAFGLSPGGDEPTEP